jgi:hypothetical protein
MNIPWWGYVVLAGLSWGTYVPIIFYGGSELGGKSNARLLAILCVGVAYFVIGVLFPLFMFLSKQEEWPTTKTTGLVFAGLAGVAGAVGAICVVFASSAAVHQANIDKVPPATYRMYIAPLIFGLAPIINTLVASVWHPKPGDPWHFDVELPDWRLFVGIVLVGAGVFLVLYSKEAAEAKKTAGGPKPVETKPADQPAPSAEGS